MRGLLLFGLLMVAAGCHKSAISREMTCTTLSKSLDEVSVCAEKITVDGRCPADVQCIWQGYAIVQCRFTKNQISSTIELSTLRHPAVPVNPDTTLQGYHVELISLSGPAEHPKAEVRITAR